MNNRHFTTRRMVAIALMGALATALMFLETPLPFMPPFLKLDVSAVPVMVGSFMFGPVEGLLIAGLKSAVHLMSTQTAGVGELADFLITGSFALTAGFIYAKNKTKKGAVTASVASIFVVSAVGALANYYLLLPFYAAAFMPYEAIIAMCQAINPNITGIGTYILWGVIPFNLVKGTIVAFLTFVVYKRLAGFIRKYADSSAPLRKKPLTEKV